jgi:DNA-binding GntR family transcriptional regulator
MVSVFYTMTASQRLLYFRDPRRGLASHKQHLDMFAAIERNDADSAGDLMTAHLQGVDSYWPLLAEPDAVRAELPAAAEG